jgi:hypothetical protein
MSGGVSGIPDGSVWRSGRSGTAMTRQRSSASRRAARERPERATITSAAMRARGRGRRAPPSGPRRCGASGQGDHLRDARGAAQPLPRAVATFVIDRAAGRIDEPASPGARPADTPVMAARSLELVAPCWGARMSAGRRRALAPSAFHAFRRTRLASRLRTDSTNELSTVRAGSSPSLRYSLASAR